MRNTFRSFLTVIAVIGLVSMSFTACDDSPTTETVPGAVSNFTATPGNGQVSLSWSAPSNDGGAVITHYEVSSNNGSTWVTAITNTSHTFTGLTNGTSYTFRVRAVNSIGKGVLSQAVTATPSESSNEISNTNPDVGTGSQENRRYRVEVFNIDSATYSYINNTYGGKTYQDVVRADVISKGHTTPINTYTNQTFTEVLSRWNSTANSIGLGSSMTTNMVNSLTDALQTNNRSGHCLWVLAGATSNYRFFYVNETSTGIYTVEVYSINSATYNHISNMYSGKTYQDVIRADVISRGHTTPINTYTNQTFTEVLSRWNSTASSIGLGSDMTTSMVNSLTGALQTYNRSGHCLWVFAGVASNYRFFYVNQE